MAEGKALEPTAAKVRLAASGRGKGSHAAFFANELLVVEWYDHGEHLPFEKVDQLLFDAAGQRRLLGEAAALPPAEALNALARRFDSYWGVQQQCAASGIACRKLTDYDV